MTSLPLIESVSESEHTLGCRSRSLPWTLSPRCCPLRFENLVRSFQLDEPGPVPDTVGFRHGLAKEPTMDTLEPAGELGCDRVMPDLKLSCGHKYIDE